MFIHFFEQMRNEIPGQGVADLVQSLLTGAHISTVANAHALSTACILYYTREKYL